MCKTNFLIKNLKKRKVICDFLITKMSLAKKRFLLRHIFFIFFFKCRARAGGAPPPAELRLELKKALKNIFFFFRRHIKYNKSTIIYHIKYYIIIISFSIFIFIIFIKEQLNYHNLHKFWYINST